MGWDILVYRQRDQANAGEVVRTESLTLSQERAASEKSSDNNLGYAVKSRLARQRTVFRSVIWFGLEN